MSVTNVDSPPGADDPVLSSILVQPLGSSAHSGDRSSVHDLPNERHFVENAAQRGDDDANADRDIIVSKFEL